MCNNPKLVFVNMNSEDKKSTRRLVITSEI